jgi:hypothetical protein
MNVLDPFEVYEVEMWPMWELQHLPPKTAAQILNAAEYTAFQQLLTASKYKAVLNEKDMVATESTTLPTPVRLCIVPEELREARRHPDVRIARRAMTISSLAKVISERDVSPGLRRTLLTQASRLERLAGSRFADFADDPIEQEHEE